MNAARFDIGTTKLQDLFVVQRKVIGDKRGFLSRFYCAEELAVIGFDKPIAQINHTLTCKKGAVRGMHFQRAPYAEIKFVSCLKGEIWDVAVDLRSNSPTFLQWHGELLSAANRKSLLIPKGFAHGFQAMTEDCELIYLHTQAYQQAFEGALNVRDPKICIGWPLEITEISDRDRNHKFIDHSFLGFIL